MEGVLPPIGIEPVVLGGGKEGPVVDDGSGGGDWVGVAIKLLDGRYRVGVRRRGVIMMRAEWMCHVFTPVLHMASSSSEN